MNYYKILNENEKHFDMQYKTGLNVDVEPFNPSGDCELGGICFADKDILAFLYNGLWLRKVTVPEGEEVYENPDYPKKYKAHQVILGEREKITPEVIERLIKEGADVHARNDEALRWATSKGYLEVVKVLLEYDADVRASDNEALCWAAEKGYLEIAKLLLKKGANVHADNNYPLRWANTFNHLEVVKLLKKHM